MTEDATICVCRNGALAYDFRRIVWLPLNIMQPARAVAAPMSLSAARLASINEITGAMNRVFGSILGFPV